MVETQSHEQAEIEELSALRRAAAALELKRAYGFDCACGILDCVRSLSNMHDLDFDQTTRLIQIATQITHLDVPAIGRVLRRSAFTLQALPVQEQLNDG